MATSEGAHIAQSIHLKIEELKKACEGIDEDTASRAPEGRWSPKEVLSHLLGEDDSGHLPLFQAFLDQDMPTVSLHPGNPFFSEKRARMTLNQLLAEVEKEYDRIAEFAKGLSETEGARKAHVPEIKDSPMGEYPALKDLLAGLGEFHLQFHIDQMREILRELEEQSVTA